MSRRAVVWILLSIAFCLSIGLIVASFTLHGSTTNVSSGVIGEGTRTATYPEPGLTLVQEDGARVVAVVASPAVGTVLVAGALWWNRRLKHEVLWAVALVIATLCGALALLAILTVGPFVLPVAGLLLAACLVAKADPMPRAPRSHTARST